METLPLTERILYEDNHLLIVNKLAGEIVQGDKTGDTPLSDALKDFLKERDHKPGNVFLGVTHRIDRPVSGLCIFAKTSKALERMNRLFAQGDVHKTYRALLTQRPRPDAATLTHYLTRNEKQNKSYAWPSPRPDAKEAALRYRFLESTEHYHLVEVELLTGRHHQIRCQMAAIGCPIKGDLKYGAPRSNPGGGISLHAYRIVFTHPVSQKEITVISPLDKLSGK